MSAPFPGVPDQRLRTTTADRERAVDVLKNAFSEGRLSRDEFEQRCHAALSSATYGELQRLTADLPTGFTPRLPERTGSAQLSYPPLPTRGPNSYAVASLVCGLVPVPLAAGIAAVVLGHMGIKQVQETGEDGRGMAVAGMVLGYVHLAFIVAWLVGILVLVGTVSGHVFHP